MSATREGVVVNPRNEMMAEIQKARQEQLAQEFKEGGGDLTALEPHESQPAKQEVLMPEGTDAAEWEKLDEVGKSALVEAEAERKKAEAEAGTETPPETVEPVQKAKRKLKVDGQDLEVDEEKVIEAGIATLQKQAAADKSLEEARRLRKEAQDEARKIVEEAKQQAAAKPNQDVGALPPAGGISGVERLTDDHFIEAVKKIQYGSEAEASVALKGLISEAAKAGKPAELTLNEVGEYLEFREATKWAHDEYKDILGDSRLKALFSSEEKRLRATGDNRPYRELYKDIGEGLKEWLKEKSPAPVQQPKDQSRHERKASVVVIPTAAARQPAPTQPKELSPSEVIDRMRTARHQA
jgi:hypothetical protein